MNNQDVALQTLVNLVQILGFVISIATFIIVIYQSHLMRKTFMADHERRRKQSTIEFVSNLRSHSWILELEITKKFGKERISVDDLGVEDELKIGRFLSLCEQLCTGVNIGVHDYFVVQRLVGYHLVSMYNRLEPYILKSRESKTKRYAIEFEIVKNRIQNEPAPSFDLATVKYSET